MYFYSVPKQMKNEDVVEKRVENSFQIQLFKIYYPSVVLCKKTFNTECIKRLNNNQIAPFG